MAAIIVLLTDWLNQGKLREIPSPLLPPPLETSHLAITLSCMPVLQYRGVVCGNGTCVRGGGEGVCLGGGGTAREGA